MRRRAGRDYSHAPPSLSEAVLRTDHDPTRRTALQVIQPHTLADAVAACAAYPEGRAIAGGTGVMVELNGGVHRPAALIDVSRVAALSGIERSGSGVRIGAAVPYTALLERLAEPLPLLVAAVATIASRQIRNRATLGGALALADPSSDALCALVAARAEVELAGPAGTRRLPVERFLLGPGECDLRPGELIAAVAMPVAAGPAAYAKVGARNAMARAVVAVAVALDVRRQSAAVCAAGVGPTPLRLPAVERLVEQAAPWDGASGPPAADAAPGGPGAAEPWLQRCAAVAAEAVDPRPDERGSVAYRRHATGVLVRRALARATSELGSWR